MKRISSQPSDFFSNRKALILVVLGTALAVRLLFLDLAFGTFLWDGIWSDAATYNQWARRIVVNNDWIGQDPFFMSPLYPYFLASVYSIFGESLLAVRIIQAIAGVTTAVLIFLIGERLFSSRAGFFGGMLAALYGPFVLSNSLLLVETLKVLFLLLTCWLLLVAVKENKNHWWVGAGAVLGLSVLCRPSDLLVVPVVGSWMFWILKGARRQKRFVLFVAGVIMIIAPVTLRNLAVSGDFIPITSNGGLNFYIGNNPDAVGVYYNVDRLDLANDPDGRVYLESQLGMTLRHSEVSPIWLSKAMDFVFSEPIAFLSLLARKFVLIFHYKEISQLGYNYVFVSQHAVSILSYLPAFIIIGPLGVLGLVAARNRWKRLFLLYGLLFAQVTSIMLFFVTDRFRLSIIPFLLLFAGFGVVYLLEKIKSKDEKSLMKAGAIILASVLGMTIMNFEIKDEFSLEWEHVGLLHFNKGDHQNALAAYQEAARYKDSFHIRNNVGNVFVALGRTDEALQQFRIGHSMNPSQAISTFSMGTAYVNRQDWRSALSAFDEAIRINPRFAPAYLNKGLVFYYLGRFEDALPQLKRYVELEPDRTKHGSVLGDIRRLEDILRNANPSSP